MGLLLRVWLVEEKMSYLAGPGLGIRLQLCQSNKTPEDKSTRREHWSGTVGSVVGFSPARGRPGQCSSLHTFWQVLERKSIGRLVTALHRKALSLGQARSLSNWQFVNLCWCVVYELLVDGSRFRNVAQKGKVTKQQDCLRLQWAVSHF